jgi:hypothetical protein
MHNERRLVRLVEVQPQSTHWLWPNRVPLGAISLIEGDPGQSKSLLTYDLVARMSSGRPMPNCTGSMTPAGAVLVQGEDSLGTMRANLEAARADLGRIVTYDKARFGGEPLLLPKDVSILERAAADVQAKLVVIDPFVGFLDGNINVERDVRKALAPLDAFAKRADLAIVLVRHRSKTASRNPIFSGAGSIALIAQSRSALLVASDPSADDVHRHILAQTKTNLARAVSLSYRTVQLGDGIVIDWLGESTYSAHNLTGSGREEQSMLHEASYVLYSILTEGPVWSREVIRLAAQAGITKRTLDRAKQGLGVKARKHGSGRGSRWIWEFPGDQARFRAFKARDIDDLMDRLIYGNDAPYPDDEWKHPSR